MLNVYDTGHEWVRELMWAAGRRRVPARRVAHPSQVAPGHMFYVPNQFPAATLMKDQARAASMYGIIALRWITDVPQIEVYEDKLQQTMLWHDWMPETFIGYSKAQALAWLDEVDGPLISKTTFGSASHNVRLLSDHEAAAYEAEFAFGAGISVRRGPGASVVQKGYVLWQKFVPHEFTWRVTIVGSKFHVYKRFNYADRPMACPSKVKQTEPVPMCEKVESLLAWAKGFFAAAGTKWCAIDVLEEPTGSLHRWRLLETSLAWARGDDPAGNAPFYGTTRTLNTQFDLLLDELEAGAW